MVVLLNHALNSTVVYSNHSYCLSLCKYLHYEQCSRSDYFSMPQPHLICVSKRGIYQQRNSCKSIFITLSTNQYRWPGVRLQHIQSYHTGITTVLHYTIDIIQVPRTMMPHHYIMLPWRARDDECNSWLIAAVPEQGLSLCVLTDAQNSRHYPNGTVKKQ